jgi:hypothetical protein
MAWLDTVADDLETMLQGEWGESVTITTGSATETGAGIFDLTYEEVNLTTQQKVQSKNSRVSLYAPAWEASGVLGETLNDKNAASWVFTIRGINYRSKTVQLDGTGWALVYLTRAHS